MQYPDSHDAGERMMAVVQALCALPPRQGVGEAAAANLIRGWLDSIGIPYLTQYYDVTDLPSPRSATLNLGDEQYSAPHVLPSSSVEGLISSSRTGFIKLGADELNSSGFDSIVFCNPHCSSPSQLFLFPVPAISVASPLFNKAQQTYNNGRFTGFVHVDEMAFRGQNIIVGNSTQTPRVLVVAHYDAIRMGALDNASGVAVVLQLIQEMRDAAGIVFALCGTEEYPVGEGYNALFRKNPLLKAVEKICVIDCVGSGQEEKFTVNLSDCYRDLLYAGFPVEQEIFDEVLNRLILIMGCNGRSGFLQVAHSDADVPSNLNPELLKQAFLCAYREVFNAA